jgi:hypothetical protein
MVYFCTTPTILYTVNRFIEFVLCKLMMFGLPHKNWTYGKWYLKDILFMLRTMSSPFGTVTTVVLLCSFQWTLREQSTLQWMH